MTEIEALTKRIEELEAEVARLKAQPVHLHYYYPPTLLPGYYPQPAMPYPNPLWPTITYGGVGTAG